MGWERLAQGSILNLMDSRRDLGDLIDAAGPSTWVVVWPWIGRRRGGVLRKMELRMSFSLHWDTQEHCLSFSSQ